MNFEPEKAREAFNYSRTRMEKEKLPRNLRFFSLAHKRIKRERQIKVKKKKTMGRRKEKSFLFSKSIENVL
jgi:hypothetical protein